MHRKRSTNTTSKDDVFKPILDAWKINDKAARQLIIKTVADNTLHLIKNKSTAKAMWDSITVEYANQSSTRIVYLMRKLHS